KRQRRLVSARAERVREPPDPARALALGGEVSRYRSLSERAIDTGRDSDIEHREAMQHRLELRPLGLRQAEIEPEGVPQPDQAISVPQVRRTKLDMLSTGRPGLEAHVRTARSYCSDESPYVQATASVGERISGGTERKYCRYVPSGSRVPFCTSRTVSDCACP